MVTETVRDLSIDPIRHEHLEMCMEDELHIIMFMVELSFPCYFLCLIGWYKTETERSIWTEQLGSVFEWHKW